MTRFARGKTTHQRREADSTPWTALKETPAKPDKKNRNSAGPSPNAAATQNSSGEKAQNGNGNGFKKDFKKGNKPDFKRKSNNYYKKDQTNSKPRNNNNREEEESANFTPVGGKNVKGYGQSKTVLIFGQFWVGPEDARRLQGLVKKLKAQGLSRQEIMKALKSEQRVAEKAAKRRRDKTCFSCRQFGHVLFDCPNLKGKSGGDDSGNTEDTGAGLGLTSDGEICFKCGSTEHTSRFCKKKADKFDFAKCFICSQSGHIARQCPSNTKGIYPAGGSCDECGSVNHLKKGCPDVIGHGDVDDGEPDPSAQVSRISDPYLSTEYEEIPEQEPTNSEEEPKSSIPMKKQFKNTVRKQNQKGKRKADVSEHTDDDSNVQQKLLSIASTTSVSTPDFSLDVPQRPQPPKKRKVVKF